MALNRILADPSYLRSLKKYSDTEISEIRTAVTQLPNVFGKPHIHAGLGIRKLGKKIFELRSGLKVRVLFTPYSGGFVLLFAGNHDQVLAWLKENA